MTKATQWAIVKAAILAVAVTSTLLTWPPTLQIAVKFLIDEFADTTLLCIVPSAALKRFAPVVAPLVSVFVAIVMALASLSWGSL